ncbi:PepSY domain-containing protein [Pseudomonas sp. AA-38]|uniref:PepSY domain-containing protein n=1 Tax=Pseudomonas sp. AA-38 TaxID=3028807 RepID=UPI0023F8372B|nr:PepSY domain-containing protein [Pseudomonas sp. AA-38]
MGWKELHRWLGLIAGSLAVVLGLTGALLAVDPLLQAWQAPATGSGTSVGELAEHVQKRMPDVEELRRLPSGAIVAFGFDGEQPQANYVDPLDGHTLAAYEPSTMPRWVKKLHRSLLLGDAGRWGAAGTALTMALLSLSGLVLLLRRMGGWRQLAGPVRGSFAQRLHVLVGRVALPVLCLSSVTALFMSATTLEVVTLDAGSEPDVVSAVAENQNDLPASQSSLLLATPVEALLKLNFPHATDPEDVWTLTTHQGQGWVDRYSGQTLAWQATTPAQRLYDWATVLHTGESAWPWAIVLGLMGASVPLFWITGLLVWWQARCEAVRITDNSPLSQADTLVFVASESGSTWGFAQALHNALVQGGHRVHTSGLEHFQISAATRRVLILAATHGEGQPPTHARNALARIGREKHKVPVAVLGFGDRQFPAFCGFALKLDQTLRDAGWLELLPLECIHQQSGQQFVAWGEALGKVLNEPLVLEYVPHLPSTTSLTLTSCRDYTGQGDRPVKILRFTWPHSNWCDRLRGRGLAHFAAGDLLGILAPGTSVPRFYSLASGSEDGFLEICVRRLPGGLCSTYLHGLNSGDKVQAFIRPNPTFTLHDTKRPVVLIGAGTGVAPLAGFIRRNDRQTPMHLYYGGRSPDQDFLFDTDINHWLDEHRLASLRTAFSRVTDGGGYVQDALRRDATRLRELLASGAMVRVCGSRPMGLGVAEVLDEILAPIQLSVRQLKDKGRYAEDLF